MSKFVSSEGDRGGTEMYMAPEQFNSLKKTTKQADIYSFGAILHDIYDGGDRTPYSKLKAQGSIGYIIEKCTEEDPRKRFKNVAKLRSALLTTLEKEKISITDDEQVWVDKINNLEKWTEEELEQLIFSIDKFKNPNAILIEINRDLFREFLEIDKYLWEDLVHKYLEWVKNSEFEYDFCDVLIGRILEIYELTKNVDTKTQCIISSAELGVYHNRWYVMHRVIRMSSPEIEENLAKRLAIEIQVDAKLKQNINLCLKQISLPSERLHELIVSLI